MKIHKEAQPNSIPVRDMKDGQVAVITKWASVGYDGRVVQRCGGDLISLGCGLDGKWAGFFGGLNGNWWDLFKEGAQACEVRILPPGTLLEI